MQREREQKEWIVHHAANTNLEGEKTRVFRQRQASKRPPPANRNASFLPLDEPPIMPQAINIEQGRESVGKVSDQFEIQEEEEKEEEAQGEKFQLEIVKKKDDHGPYWRYEYEANANHILTTECALLQAKLYGHVRGLADKDGHQNYVLLNPSDSLSAQNAACMNSLRVTQLRFLPPSSDGQQNALICVDDSVQSRLLIPSCCLQRYDIWTDQEPEFDLWAGDFFLSSVLPFVSRKLQRAKDLLDARENDALTLLAAIPFPLMLWVDGVMELKVTEVKKLLNNCDILTLQNFVMMFGIFVLRLAVSLVRHRLKPHIHIPKSSRTSRHPNQNRFDHSDIAIQRGGRLF